MTSTFQVEGRNSAGIGKADRKRRKKKQMRRRGKNCTSDAVKNSDRLMDDGKNRGQEDALSGLVSN